MSNSEQRIAIDFAKAGARQVVSKLPSEGEEWNRGLRRTSVTNGATGAVIARRIAPGFPSTGDCAPAMAPDDIKVVKAAASGSDCARRSTLKWSASAD